MKNSILSWNVLYINYEKKYCPNSKILQKFDNKEGERLNHIIFVLLQQVGTNMIFCLQECSFELLRELNIFFSSNYNIFAYNVQEDEYLVTITPNDFKCIFSYKNESSNGYLIVENDKYIVVNCHLIPQRYSNINILKYLNSLKISSKPIFIAGDFNEKHNIVKRQLGNNYICPYYGKTYKNRSIDHIIFDKNYIDYKIDNICQDNISDHNPIILYFTL